MPPNPQEGGTGRRRYPPEFRRKVLDLLEAGRSVADVAADLQISDQSIYSCRRRQDRIDRGPVPGLTSAEKAELIAARKRIVDLETELKTTRRAMELVREAVRAKRRFEAIAVMAAEGLPVQVACRVLKVSRVGLLRVAQPAPVGAGGPARLAHRPDPARST